MSAQRLDFDGQDPNDGDNEECKTADDVNVPVAILCSSNNDDEEDLPFMTTNTSSTGAVLSVPGSPRMWKASCKGLFSFGFGHCYENWIIPLN